MHSSLAFTVVLIEYIRNKKLFHLSHLNTSFLK